QGRTTTAQPPGFYALWGLAPYLNPGIPAPDRPIKIQATLAKTLMNSRFTAILTRDEGVAAAARLTPQDKARIRSAGGPGSSAWLEALPNRWVTRLTNEHM
ncbi:unnamed protein product, partial [Heterosigma akashiwo]